MDKERMATDIVRFVRLFLNEWRIIPMKNESDVVLNGNYMDMVSDLHKWDPPEDFGTLKSRRDLWILGVNVHEMYTQRSYLPLCSVKIFDPRMRPSFGTRGFVLLCRNELPAPNPNVPELVDEVRSLTCCWPILCLIFLN